MPSSRARSHGRLGLTIVGNAFMRIAAGASGVLIGLYLADLANRGLHVDAGLVGILGSVTFGAELIAVIPMGLASDALAPRGLMAGGALLGAAATQILGLSSLTSFLFLSRIVQGLSAAAVTPSLLSHLTDATYGDHRLRARVMTYFELSLLGGIALGGLTGAQLWHFLKAGAFGASALIYVVSAGLLFFGAVGSRGHGAQNAFAGFFRALKQPSLRRLAPVWLSVNTIVGLWLGPMLPFLLTQKTHSQQFLAGIFAGQPERVGWLLFGYALVFGVGLTGWSFILPQLTERRAMRIALVAMTGVCLGLFLLNHGGNESPLVRWTVGILTSLCVMVESGFTPAALSLLAGHIGPKPGRGAAMGIYSVLLGLGAVVGSLLAALLGQAFAIDGLIYGTLAMALLALSFLKWVGPSQSLSEE